MESTLVLIIFIVVVIVMVMIIEAATLFIVTDIAMKYITTLFTQVCAGVDEAGNVSGSMG